MVCGFAAVARNGSPGVRLAHPVTPVYCDQWRTTLRVYNRAQILIGNLPDLWRLPDGTLSARGHLVAPCLACGRWGGARRTHARRLSQGAPPSSNLQKARTAGTRNTDQRP